MFYNVHFTLCSAVCLSVQLNKHAVFYNMHFTLCSRVCRSDFLGVSVQLTHVLGSTLYFPFSLFPCNLLTYYMLQCALHTMFYYVPALLSRLFSLTHSYTVFSTGNFQFSICFSATHSYTMFHNVHFTLCLQCAGLFF